VGQTLPQGAGEQDTDQVTPLLARSLPTVAVIGAVVVPSTLPGLCVMFTVIAETVTLTEAVALESATELAVRVTCKSLAGGGGAV